MTKIAEIASAKEQVEWAWIAWNMADREFEETAWFSYLSARERLNALLVTAKMTPNTSLDLTGFTAAS